MRLRMLHIFRSVTLVTLFLCLCQPVWAQKNKKSGKRGKIKILNVDEFDFDKEKYGDVKILVGNVKFKHKKVVMYCDSAILNDDGTSLKAYRNVRIVRGRDKTTLTGDSLDYNSLTKWAKVRGNITMIDKDKTLKTNILNFNQETNQVKYFGGGVIVDKKENSTLKSKNGYFYSRQEKIYFNGNVEIKTEDYTIYSDTMMQDQRSDITYFYGPTRIISDSTEAKCKRGIFDQRNKRYTLVEKASVVQEFNSLYGDSIIYFINSGYGEVFGHAIIKDGKSDFIVSGDYAKYNKSDSSSLVRGNIEYIQIFEKDSLFLHADTLYSEVDEKTGDRLLLAYNHVKFYKSDMQGKCDSLVFNNTDSLLNMYIDPVIWAQKNQMTGDTIVIKNKDGELENIEIRKNAYVISEEDTVRYNQVKGRNLKAFFIENEIHKIDVKGNGQTIYYGKEEDGSIMGMNRLECSNMTIHLIDNGIQRIHFYVKPDATFFPLEGLQDSDMLLRNFSWRELERPKKRKDIFVR